MPWAAPAAPQMDPGDPQKTAAARKPWIFIICISQLKLLIWANGTRNTHGERPVTASHTQASISQCQKSLPRPQVMNRANADRLCSWAPEQAAALGSPTLGLGPVACCSSHGPTPHQREKRHRGHRMVGNGRNYPTQHGCRGHGAPSVSLGVWRYSPGWVRADSLSIPGLRTQTQSPCRGLFWHRLQSFTSQS